MMFRDVRDGLYHALEIVFNKLGFEIYHFVGNFMAHHFSSCKKLYLLSFLQNTLKTGFFEKQNLINILMGRKRVINFLSSILKLCKL